MGKEETGVADRIELDHNTVEWNAMPRETFAF